MLKIGKVTVKGVWDATPTEGIEVVLHPGFVMGIGIERTTRQFVLDLEGRDLTGCTVADIGTGTGILAILAAKLGARLCYAVDVNPQAIAAARRNVEANGVAHLVEVLQVDFHELEAPVDLALANLGNASLIIECLAHMAPILTAGGRLVVMGQTQERKQVELAAEGWGYLVEKATTVGEFTHIVFRRE